MKARDHRWRYIVHNGQRITNVVLLADGTASGDGVDAATALDAATAALARLATRRSASAQKAAVSRDRRTTQRLELAVRHHLTAGGVPPGAPLGKCFICRHKLTDDVSKRRGVGSDCWARMMVSVNEREAKELLP